jgi:hypothetical protein
MPAPTDRVFVLDIDRKPILAFIANNMREAMELSKEAWLREDLTDLSSQGVALWDGEAKMTVRGAAPDEVLTYQAGAAMRANTGLLSRPRSKLAKMIPAPRVWFCGRDIVSARRFCPVRAVML